MASRTPKMRLSSLLCLLPLALRSVSALSQQYCSSQNTGGSLALESIYMSNGKCYDTCVDNYAYAIVQDDNCWCSNFTPSNQVSVSNCNVQCPGYPSDLCGNSGQGLYGYIALTKQPSGTASGSSGSASSTSSSTDTTPASKVTPVTSVQVVTYSGNVVTQTVTSTPTSGSTAMLGAKKSSSMAPGLIAAAVVASVLGAILLGLLALFFFRRQRKSKDDEKFGGLRDSSSPSNLNRNASTHSKSGLLDRAYPPTITTRVSSNGGLDVSSSDAVSPVTPVSERRSSKPILYDQRLNPNALMVLDNGSHTSLRTLEDHRDYGRMLKVTNPDEPGRPSFS